ncbi:gamma-glutamylcysteine synthetase [Secundilactobacillus oryzae JCM 18671]|uniref:Glutamate--cysteine ligase n=2 Tax=Secundilactobacillus oryzae TaxID=1202668 RepID=A0A081BK88_9LACO|nr:hypothetical protein [Secundilactobacillus oryzae]GAK48456.1 gamma-glutamylcysteine synthetase [Secundilactobacillus oryzae JCM 18671]
MFENLQQIIKKEEVAEQLFHSLIGIEVQERRVDQFGRLSTKVVPDRLALNPSHPYLKVDKTGTKFKVVTDPNPNIGGVLDQLDTLQTALYRTLESGDRIWPLSTSPEPAKDASTTGTHVNYSIPDPVINRLFSHYTDDFETVSQFKNALYMHLVHNFIRYQWLLTYLFGSSPTGTKNYRSTRALEIGLQRTSGLEQHYLTFDKHIAFLNRLIAEGQSKGVSGFEAPIRFRGETQPDRLKAMGVRYLELKVLDNTPFHPNGVSRHALYFIKLFMIYLLVTPESPDNLETVLREGILKNQQVAMEAPETHTAFEDEGVAVLNDVKTMANDLNAHVEQAEVLDDFLEEMTHPELTPAVMLSSRAGEQKISEFALEVATRWLAERLGSRQLLPGMSRLTAKTQEVILLAIQYGIQYFQIKDELGGDMLMLTYDSITQVVLLTDIEKYQPRELIRKLFPAMGL